MSSGEKKHDFHLVEPSPWPIYVSFATLGVGFAIYLTLAFWLRLKDLVYTKRTSVFDL